MNTVDLADFLSSNLATFVRSDEEDELDQLFSSLAETELDASLIRKQYTASNNTLERATTANETSGTIEPTTTLSSSNNDVASQVACPSHDAQDHAQAMSSFATASKSDLQTFADKTRNYNTTKTTLTWIKIFDTWRKARNIQERLENIPVDHLDEILQFFFAEVRKNDGSEYEPDSLRTMLSSLDRWLREKGQKYSIIKDKAFEGCRKVLNGKAISLREKGMGKRKNRSDALTLEEEKQLWEKGVLGCTNPTSLNYSIFYTISQQFGTRGCQEHHQIRVEDLKFVKDVSGKTIYVEWVEGITKTRQGGLVKESRRLPQRLYYQGHDQCPVKLLELLISKRPDELKNSGPLYLKPLDTPINEVWYTTQPVGMHTIDTYMKYIAMQGGLDLTNKKFTNHSVRKTTVHKLQKAGVSNDKIAAITGHRNEQSLRAYSNADSDDHQGISGILSSTRSHYPFQNVANIPQSHCNLLQANSHIGSGPFSSSINDKYHFSNCIVYFGFPSTPAMETPGQSPNQPYKKRRVIIDSDSD